MDMTHYALHDDLSFCRIGDRLVFLDIGKDQYFCLPRDMEQALSAYPEGQENSDLRISRLLTKDILADQAASKAGTHPGIEAAARSAMEVPNPQRGVRPTELLEIFAIVLHTRLQLRMSSLKKVLQGIALHGRDHAAQGVPPSARVERHLSDAASIYRRARLYVPVDMRCLLDSIAMVRFLHRRDLEAHIVFGVALDPFSAHCWVQAGDLVLNDTVGNVIAHTPIRVV